MSASGITLAGGDTATPLNLEKRVRVIAGHLAPGRSRVLDGGCGSGEYVVALRTRYGVEAWGVEYLQEKVDAFREAHPEREWVSRGDLQRLEYPDGHFDVVVLNEVLEHVPDDAAALREVHRVLRPGGTLIVFSPSRLYPFETHGAYWRATGRKIRPYVPFVPYLPVRLGERFLRYRARNYWPAELRGHLRRAGFEIAETSYLWQTFENVSRNQPPLLARNARLLRRLAGLLERIPLLRAFGVSQVVVGRKEATSG